MIRICSGGLVIQSGLNVDYVAQGVNVINSHDSSSKIVSYFTLSHWQNLGRTVI